MAQGWDGCAWRLGGAAARPPLCSRPKAEGAGAGAGDTGGGTLHFAGITLYLVAISWRIISRTLVRCGKGHGSLYCAKGDRLNARPPL